jgi:hypothetical protein
MRQEPLPQQRGENGCREHDAERSAGEIRSRWYPGKLLHDEFEIGLDRDLKDALRIARWKCRGSDRLASARYARGWLINRF